MTQALVEIQRGNGGRMLEEREVREALDVVMHVVRGTAGRGAATKLFGCRLLLDHWRWQVEQEQRDPVVLLRELFADDEQFLEWLDKTRPMLVERMQRERAGRLLPNGGANDDGRSEGT